MSTEILVIPKPAYNLLRRLTGESRPDVALSLALKELTRLKLEEARVRSAAYEKKYGLSFQAFAEDWRAEKIANAYSYAVEKDYWEWEAAVTDARALEELGQWLA